MIYDCFTFFNELDLLEIRLNVLKDVVDRFVIVESDRTFTGRPKPLVFAENRERFAAFSERIIHVVVRDHPPFVSAWHEESHQRNAIARGLEGAHDDDVVIVADVDEIPNPEAVRRYAGRPGMVAFQQRYFAYYLNFLNVRRRRWRSAKMVSYATFCHGFDGVKTLVNEFVPEAMNAGTTASKIRGRELPRSRGGTFVAKDGGWHFTSLGGAEALSEKMRSFSHQEYNPGEGRIDVEELAGRIRRGEGAFWKMNCFAVSPERYLPRYVLEHRERYAGLMLPFPPPEDCRARWVRRWRTLQGLVIAVLEGWCPARLHNALHLWKVRRRVSPVTPAPSPQPPDRLAEYAAWLLECNAGFAAAEKTLRFAVDCSNGMAAILARRLFPSAEILNGEIDGSFPAHSPNPLKAESRVQLAAVVRERKLDFGVIFDGDADRAMFVDERGEFVQPDYLIPVVARATRRLTGADEGRAVIHDVRTSRGAIEALREDGFRPEMVRVGHAFAKPRLRELKALCGGELAGHYYFEEFYGCDSGALAAMRVIGEFAVAKAAGRTFSAMMASIVTRYENSGEINFKVEDKDAAIARVLEAAADRLPPETGRSDLDGLRVEYEDGWFNVRKSNTEPYLRLIVERRQRVDEWVSIFSAAIEG